VTATVLGVLRPLWGVFKGMVPVADQQEKIDRLTDENRALLAENEELKQRLEQERLLKEQLNAGLSSPTLHKDEIRILRWLAGKPSSSYELSIDLSMEYEKATYHLHRMYERTLVVWSDGIEGEVWSLHQKGRGYLVDIG